MSKPDLSKLHRSELEAIVVDMAKTAERYRVSIGMIALGIEDEGDRAYFGSTNDAEELRDIEQELAEPGNWLACPWMHGADLWADLRKLRERNTELLIALKALDCSDILGCAESCASGHERWDHVSRKINAARAVIARATGAA